MFFAPSMSSTKIGVSYQQSSCPYDSSATDICGASLSLMTISSCSREIYCSTDNYDNCPVFLAKVLRNR